MGFIELYLEGLNILLELLLYSVYHFITIILAILFMITHFGLLYLLMRILQFLS